jgi:hypothetical protein
MLRKYGIYGSITLLLLATVGIFAASSLHAPQLHGPSPFPAAVSSGPQTYQWRFTTENESSTDVTLVLDDLDYYLGRYRGTCFAIDGTTAPYLTDHEVIAAQCWSDNGGDEIGVFNENGILKFMHAVLTKQSPAYRHNFETLFEYRSSNHQTSTNKM